MLHVFNICLTNSVLRWKFPILDIGKNLEKEKKVLVKVKCDLKLDA